MGGAILSASGGHVEGRWLATLPVFFDASTFHPNRISLAPHSMDPKEFKRQLSRYKPVRSSEYVGKSWFDPKGAAAAAALFTAITATTTKSPKATATKSPKADTSSADSGGDDFWAHLSAAFARRQQQACGKTAAEAAAIAGVLVRRAREWHDAEDKVSSAHSARALVLDVTASAFFVDRCPDELCMVISMLSHTHREMMKEAK